MARNTIIWHHQIQRNPRTDTKREPSVHSVPQNSVTGKERERGRQREKRKLKQKKCTATWKKRIEDKKSVFVRKTETATLWKTEADKESIDKSRPFIRFGMFRSMLLDAHQVDGVPYVRGVVWHQRTHEGCCYACVATFAFNCQQNVSQFRIIFSLLADGIFSYIVQCSLRTMPTAKSQQQIYMKMKHNIYIF